jgi:hypothetical protein
LICDADAPVAESDVGTEGGVVSPPFPPLRVIALADVDCEELFAAASYAETVYEYCVDAARPEFRYEFVVDVAIWTPPR